MQAEQFCLQGCEVGSAWDGGQRHQAERMAGAHTLPDLDPGLPKGNSVPAIATSSPTTWFLEPTSTSVATGQGIKYFNDMVITLNLIGKCGNLHSAENTHSFPSAFRLSLKLTMF